MIRFGDGVVGEVELLGGDVWSRFENLDGAGGAI